MTIRLVVGSEAELLLKDATFQARWNSLYHDCLWATPSQSFGFVTTWYEIYSEYFQPVLVYRLMPDNILSGLLTLAISADLKQLVVAGTSQAEYHAWLAIPNDGDTFIRAAIELLSTRFLGRTLTFEYLPPLAPKQWLDREQNSILTTHKRPLMKLADGENIRKSLKKTGNKSRLNRLKQLGNVRFEQLYTEAELAAVFDEIIAYFDFRQGAVNDSLPFQTDRLKKSFQLALMRVKDLQHVTVLKVEDRILAAHIGLYDRQQCTIGIPIYSPFYAIHSPGKLHLLMLGLELVKQGIEILDLTPGGDAYKERFATDWDEVFVLNIFFGNRFWKKQRTELKPRFRSTVKTLMLAIGIDIKKIVKSIRSILQGRGFANDWKPNFGSKLRHNLEVNLYCYRAKTILPSRGCANETGRNFPSINRDSIADLLKFQSTSSRQTHQKFLSFCLNKIESGEHVYTWVENDLLLCCSWLVERQDKFVFAELKKEYIFESASAFIHDFYFHPIVTNDLPEKFQALLEQMLDDAVSIYGANQIYMTVLADDPRQEAIQQASLNYLDTVDRSLE